MIGVLAVANGLRSVDGENPEYDRALVELCSDLMPGFDREAARELVEFIVLEKRAPIYSPDADTAPREVVAEPVPMTRHAARAAAS